MILRLYRKGLFGDYRCGLGMGRSSLVLGVLVVWLIFWLLCRVMVLIFDLVLVCMMSLSCWFLGIGVMFSCVMWVVFIGFSYIVC